MPQGARELAFKSGLCCQFSTGYFYMWVKSTYRTSVFSASEMEQKLVIMDVIQSF